MAISHQLCDGYSAPNSYYSFLLSHLLTGSLHFPLLLSAYPGHISYRDLRCKAGDVVPLPQYSESFPFHKEEIQCASHNLKFLPNLVPVLSLTSSPSIYSFLVTWPPFIILPDLLLIWDLLWFELCLPFTPKKKTML